MNKVDEYLSLNYHRRLYQDDERDWIVEIDDLPGCIADGKTPDEAIANSHEAMRSWMESRMSSGLEIPKPSIAEEYSGRILLRMPRYIHRTLAIQAQNEGSSLNQYILSLISYGCAQTHFSQLQTMSLRYHVFPAHQDLNRNNRLLLGGSFSTATFQGAETREGDEVLAGLAGSSRQGDRASLGGVPRWN